MNETISDEQLDADLRRLGGAVPELPEGLAARIDNLMIDHRIDSMIDESKPPKSRAWIAVAAAVTLLAGGVVVGTSMVSTNPGAESVAGPFDGPPPGGDPTRMPVDALLLASSEKLASAPATGAPFTFVEEHAWWMSSGDGERGTYAFLGENVLQTWIPADANGEWLQRRSVSPNRQWITGNEEIAGELALGSWPEGEFRGRRGQFFPTAGDVGTDGAAPASFANPTVEYLDGLPDDPTALYEKLRSESDSDAQLLSDVASGLRTGLVSNQVTSNIYRALVALPTLEITEGLANLDGRIGTAVGVVDNGRRTEIIIDPATGEFIGQRVVTLDGYDGIPPGTAVEFSSVTRSGVDTAGTTPGTGTR
ncbi:hypothetical protein M2284_002283 [Rhodococcus sp. LBL1]|nr:hypothetical protein [Rhodococcus sp. LBL1]MDH6683667.1 hypothetical protein [Rhodococcus sp. LBL2]